MKRVGFILVMILIYGFDGFGQAGKITDSKLLFNGIVRDASTLEPLPNSQITINRSFTSVSETDGTFAIRVSRKDTVGFSLLGYHSSFFYVSDSLAGTEFMAGVYMNTDTMSIGEVIIIPRYPFLRSDILKAPAESKPEIENAKYNMAISAYQGRIAISTLGDPASNYALLHQKQAIDASEKGGIPSDRMVGFSPFSLIGVAYLLLHGLPEKPVPMKSTLTRQELDQLNNKYLESLNKK
jgi:hypothetical protein